MTDERVTLWAGSYSVICPQCGHLQVLSHAAVHVECPKCRTMILTSEPKHTLSDQVDDVMEPGSLCITTYRWECPDCGTVNDVVGVTDIVRCRSCGAELEVAEARAMPKNGQMRLV
jgi:ribosomal protein S27E